MVWFEKKFNINRRSSSTDFYNFSKSKNPSEFLEELSNMKHVSYLEIKDKVVDFFNSLLNKLLFHKWVYLLSIDDNFKFLLQFIKNLEDFHDKKIGKNNKDFPEKMKTLQFSEDLEHNFPQCSKHPYNSTYLP